MTDVTDETVTPTQTAPEPIAPAPPAPAPATPAQVLRELCTEHYHGLLTREVYRQRRATLLDALLLGRPVPDVAVLPAEGVLREPRREETVRRERGPSRPASPPDPAPVPAGPAMWRQPVVLGSVAVALALVLGLVWWLTASDTPKPAAVADGLPGVPATPPAAAPEASRGAARQPEDFVGRFLDAPGAWTDDAVAVFLFEWDGLTPDERTSLSATPVFQRFAADLRERIIDERSLGAVSPDRGFEGFASLLGLKLDLPARAAPPVVVAAAPPVPAAKPEDRPPAAPAAAPATPVPTASATAPAAPAAVKPAAGKTAATAPPVGDSPAAPAAPAAAPVAAATATPARCSASSAAMPLSRRRCWDLLANGAKGPELIVIKAGDFTLGASDDPAARPPVQVAIGAAFAMSQHEISQREYQDFCQSVGRTCAPSPWPGADLPAVNVSFSDASDYARWLSRQTRQRYRLPTEAEWEYAARGGTSTHYSSGEQASGAQIRFGSPAPIAWQKFGSNPFGLTHMLGNVREWVQDGWEAGHAGAPRDGSARSPAGNLRTVRGGSYRDNELQVRSSSRASMDAGAQDNQTGFRVLRELGN